MTRPIPPGLHRSRFLTFTPELRAALRDCLKKEMPKARIAKVLGVAVPVVRRWIKTEVPGCDRARRHRRRDGEILRLRAEGLGRSKIAERMGLSVHVVNGVLWRAKGG